MKKSKVVQKSEMIGTITDFLVGTPVFDQLNPDELQIVAEHMNFIEINKDEIVFKEGENGDCLCFVVEGTFEIIKGSATGDSTTIATLSKGRSIGEMAIIDNFPRSATVKALTEATLVTLTTRSFELILDEHPKIGIKVLKGIARLLSLNLRKTSSRLADYMFPLT